MGEGHIRRDLLADREQDAICEPRQESLRSIMPASTCSRLGLTLGAWRRFERLAKARQIANNS